MKSWYSIKAQGEEIANIDIFDDIGIWGITARDFLADLKRLGAIKTINVRINSYGGDVFDGLAIYNALKYHEAAVTVTIYGIAASIASVIAMAGRVLMPENTFMFVHNPLGGAFGNAADMRELADALDKIKSGLIRSYVSKTGQTEEKIGELMDEDSWFTAAEAQALGFADEVLEPVKLAARADVKRYGELPKGLREVPIVDDVAPVPLDPPAPTGPSAEQVRADALEITELCKTNAVADLAGDFISAGFTVDKVRERLKDAGAIRTACTIAALPDRAPKYLKAGLTLAEVRSDLFDILGARDFLLDNHLPDHERQQKPTAIPASEIYAMRRGEKK